jgi:hypothetical protein
MAIQNEQCKMQNDVLKGNHPLGNQWAQTG